MVFDGVYPFFVAHPTLAWIFVFLFFSGFGIQIGWWLRGWRDGLKHKDGSR